MFEARLNALVAAEEAEGKAPFAFEVDYGERAEHCWNGKAQRSTLLFVIKSQQ